MSKQQDDTKEAEYICVPGLGEIVKRIAISDNGHLFVILDDCWWKPYIWTE